MYAYVYVYEYEYAYVYMYVYVYVLYLTFQHTALTRGNPKRTRNVVPSERGESHWQKGAQHEGAQRCEWRMCMCLPAGAEFIMFAPLPSNGAFSQHLKDTGCQGPA